MGNQCLVLSENDSNITKKTWERISCNNFLVEKIFGSGKRRIRFLVYLLDVHLSVITLHKAEKNILTN